MKQQEKEVFMNCSQLHWSDKKTVDENVSLLYILIVILVYMSSPELRLASLKMDVACVQIPLPSGKVGVCMGIILHKFKK